MIVKRSWLMNRYDDGRISGYHRCLGLTYSKSKAIFIPFRQIFAEDDACQHAELFGDYLMGIESALYPYSYGELHSLS